MKKKRIKEIRTSEVPDLVKVIYVYSDGTVKYIKGEDLMNYKSNLKSASSLSFAHGINFKPVNWREL